MVTPGVTVFGLSHCPPTECDKFSGNDVASNSLVKEIRVFARTSEFSNVK